MQGSQAPGVDGEGAPAEARPRARDKRTERWKHLLQRPAAARVIGVAEYVDELNRRLRSDPSYRAGVRFVVVGPSADGRFGPRPSWEGPDELKPLVFRVVQSVVGVYEADAPFFSDR